MQNGDRKIKPDSFKAWVCAIRPKTLSGAAAPVLVSCAIAFRDGVFNTPVAIIALCFALLMQIDANLINDLYDFLKGGDTEGRLGPKRACMQGWITVGAMKKGILATSAAACTIGSLLLFYGGAELIVVGLLCIVFAYLYTGGPCPLAYYGCGDLLVLLFFGIVPVCCTYYIMAQEIPSYVLLSSLACGIVIDTMLILNNFRDKDEDRKNGKITTIVLLGEKIGSLAYLFTGIAGVILAISAIILSGESLTDKIPYTVVILLPYMILHIATWSRMVKINCGKQLNMILGETSRNIIIFSLLFCLATALS